jgi:hypothetical protein
MRRYCGRAGVLAFTLLPCPQGTDLCPTPGSPANPISPARIVAVFLCTLHWGRGLLMPFLELFPVGCLLGRVRLFFASETESRMASACSH